MKRKILCSILALVMLFSFVPSIYAADIWTAHTNEVNLRFGVIADSHVKSNATTSATEAKWLAKAVQATNELSGGKPDAYMTLGDLVWFNTNEMSENAYDVVTSVFAENMIEGVPQMHVMGNHEFPLSNKDMTVAATARALFEEKMNQTPDYVTEINGYKFIGASPDNYNDPKSQELESWIMTEIDKAIAADSTNANVDGTFDEGIIPNSTKPVFLAVHHANKGARDFAYPVFDEGIDENAYDYITDPYTSQEFSDFLATRPQVVCFYGHHHLAAQVPGGVYQAGYTAVAAPLTAGGDGLSYASGTVETWQTVYAKGQGMLTEVDKNNVVKVYKYSLDTKEYIGEPWTIDIPAIVADMTNDDETDDTAHMLYSADKREESDLGVPYWKDDAQIEISTMLNGAVEITLDFDDVICPETPNQQDDFVYAWHIVLKDSYGKTVYNKEWSSGLHLTPVPEATVEVLDGLGYDNTYTLEVSPISGLGAEGAPLTKTFTTAAEVVSPEADRIEFEDVCTTYTKTNYTYASGDALVLSTQASIGSGTPVNATTDPSFTFKYTPKKTGTYDVDYVIGWPFSSYRNLMSKVTISVDGATLGSNHEQWYEDMSMSGYNENNEESGGYAWRNYIQMKKFKKTIDLVANQEYTISVDISNCQNKSLYLFGLDYIQFTPRNVDIPEGKEIKNLIRDAEGKRLSGVSISAKDMYGNDTPSYGSGYGGVIDNAVDGNDSTRWFPVFGLEYPYYQIDLGKAQNISHIRYLPWTSDKGAYWGRYIQIQASNYKDFSNYTVLRKIGTEGLDFSNGHQPVDIYLDPNVSKYRYIRFVKGGGTTWSAYGIAELDVEGYEGDDTAIKEDMTESISIKDGTVGLTNVQNVWVSNPWSATAYAKSYTYDGGKPIEVKFSSAVDMTTVDSSSVKLYKYDGTSLGEVAYTPIIDAENRSIMIDLSYLDGYVGAHASTASQYYQLQITADIQNADGSVKHIPETIKFTTNQIAKAPYVEGKAIRDVAYGKSARYKTAPAWGTITDTTMSDANAKGLIGTYTNQYTNGGIAKDSTTNNKTTGTKTDMALRYHTLAIDNPLLIDLGREYDVVGLAAASCYDWHYGNVLHYLLKEPTYDTTGLSAKWNSGNTKYQVKTAAATGTARYVLVKPQNFTQYPWEIMVYAYVDAATGFDTYFTSPVSFDTDGTTEVTTVTANVTGAGESTLIMAEFDGRRLNSVVQIAECESGKATLSFKKQEGMTYKMYLWDSITGLKPIQAALSY